MRLFDFISRGTCGDKRNLCQGCIQNIPKDKHECIYKHHYLIPQNIVALAKQINQCKEEEKEGSKIEEDRTRMINMENLIVDMQKQISKLNEVYVRPDSFC